MKRTDMLHQMCREVLAQADIKAICRNRGLPAQALSSTSLFEHLFLSDTGVVAVLKTLDSNEIALLHLLKALDKPVDIAFFHHLYGPKERSYFGTFAQRHQDTFSKVKERLVRGGLLIIALAPETYTPTTKMERWQFVLPAQVAAHLPSLLESCRHLEDAGHWCRQVARDKLKTIFGVLPGSDAGSDDKLEIVDGELRMGGQPFRAGTLLAWQAKRWREETTPAKQLPKRKPRFVEKAEEKPYTVSPTEAATQLLGTLDTGMWTDADSLTAPLAMFCGTAVDSQAVCESGWRWGCLAKQEADSHVWYRLAPHQSAADVLPHRFLDITGDGQVSLDLDTVPLASLETLVAISSQRSTPGSGPRLLLTPNLVKLGRAAEDVWDQPLAAWLKDNSAAFRQAAETCQKRRGATILHENLSVARVTDLALRVAIDKALGDRIVTLGEEFIAFPYDVLADVRRIVGKSGYVIKEASLRGS